MKDRLKIGNRVSCLIEQVAPNYIVLSFRTAGNSYKGVLINENCSTVRRKIPDGFFPAKGILDQQTTDDFCNEITNRELDTTSKSTRSKKLKQSCIILDDYDLTKCIVPAEQSVNTVDSIGKSPIDSIRGLVESIDKNSDLSFPSSKALSPSKDKPTCIPLNTKQTLDVKSEFEQKLKDMRSDLQKRMAGFSFLNASSRLLKSPVKILNRVSSFHPSFDVFPTEEAFPSCEKKTDITGEKPVIESDPGLNTSLNINSNKPGDNCSPKLLPNRNSKGMGNKSPKVASNSSPKGISIRGSKKVKENQKKITGKVNRPDDGTDTVKRSGRKRKYLEIKEQDDGVNQEKDYDKECSPPLKMRISAKGLEREDEVDNKESLLKRKRKRTKTKFSRKKQPRKNLHNSDTKNPESAPPCNAILNNTKRVPRVVKPKRIDPIQLALKNIKKYDRMRKNRNKFNMLHMGKMQPKTSLRQKRNSRRNANKTLLDKTVSEGDNTETKEARANEEHQDVPIKTKREAATKVNRCKLTTDAQKPRVKNEVDSTDDVKGLTDDTAGVTDDDKPLRRYMRKKLQLQQRSLSKKDISHSTRSKKVDKVNQGVSEETNIEKPEKPLRRHMLKKARHETETKEASFTHNPRKTNRSTSQSATFDEELDYSSQADRNINLLDAIQNMEEEVVDLHEQEGPAHRLTLTKASPQKIKSENTNETMKPNDLERPLSRYVLKKMQKQSVTHSTGDDLIQTKDLIRTSRRFKSMKTQFKMEESPKKLEELHKEMIAGFYCDSVKAPTAKSPKKIESVKETGIGIVGNALTDNLTVNDNLTERNQLSKSWVTIKDFDGFDFVETKNENFALPNDTESNSSAVTSCNESLFQPGHIDLLCHERSLPEDKNGKVNEAMSVCKPRKNRRKPMQVFKSLPNPAEEEKKRKQEEDESQERYQLGNNANKKHNVDSYDRPLTNQKSVVESKGHNTRYRGTKSVLPALNMSPRKVRKPKQQKQTSDNVENAKRIISDTIMDNQRHQRNIFPKDETGTPESSLPSSPLTPQSSTEYFSSILGVKLGSSTTSAEATSLKNIKNSKSTCNIDKSRNDLLAKKSKKKKSALMETFKTLKPLTRCTNEIRTDDIVWGKCLGFGWWPGHVISLVKHKEETPVEEREAHVSWMGSSTRSVMQLKDLDLFLPQFRKRFVSAKKGMYFKAVSQAQSACKIKYGVINI